MSAAPAVAIIRAAKSASALCFRRYSAHSSGTGCAPPAPRACAGQAGVPPRRRSTEGRERPPRNAPPPPTPAAATRRPRVARR
eukprot:4898021-Pleurochrysis_carterae.AAC.1